MCRSSPKGPSRPSRLESVRCLVPASSKVLRIRLRLALSRLLRIVSDADLGPRRRSVCAMGLRYGIWLQRKCGSWKLPKGVHYMHRTCRRVRISKQAWDAGKTGSPPLIGIPALVAAIPQLPSFMTHLGADQPVAGSYASPAWTRIWATDAHQLPIVLSLVIAGAGVDQPEGRGDSGQG